MKTYDSVEKFEKDLMGQMNKVILPNYEKLLATVIVEDAIMDKRVPIQTGALSESAYEASYIDGLEVNVVWDTDYAEDVYDWNITGVPEWDLSTWDAHYIEYTTTLWQVLTDKELKM